MKTIISKVRFAVSRTLKRQMLIARAFLRYPRKAARILVVGEPQDPSAASTFSSMGKLRSRLLSIAAIGTPSGTSDDYLAWIRAHDSILNSDIKAMETIIAGWKVRPRVSILMPVCDTPVAFLLAAIKSVQLQTYADWELCIADDASTSPEVRQILADFADSDSRIRVRFRPRRGGIAAASNTALEMATGDWIGFLDHDDQLAPHALFCVLDAVRRNPGAELLYSDEDKIGLDGFRCDPYFKPPLNLELLRSQNYLTHFIVFRASLIRRLGGLRAGFEGSQDYDLILRAVDDVSAEAVVHIPHVLYHWRVHSQSTAKTAGAKPAAAAAGARALSEHLQRRGVGGTVEITPFGYRVCYATDLSTAQVSIVVPTRNLLDHLKRCVDSIFSAVENVRFELIIIDNGSDDVSTLNYLAELAHRTDVRVIRDDGEFNYSRLNNKAVALARGQYVVLLNNDTEVITKNWLSTMVSIMSQPDVGAVGVRLLYPDGTIQHGGVIVGNGGIAGNAHLRRLRSERGYFGRAQLQQEYGAVTAACMMLRRADYEAVGGLDEVHLPIAFNDVDLCLKLRQLGKRVVWTPYIELIHHESLSRGFEDTPERRERFGREARHMRTKWSKELEGSDPGYNPNLEVLGRSESDFRLAQRPRVAKPWT